MGSTWRKICNGRRILWIDEMVLIAKSKDMEENLNAVEEVFPNASS